MAVNNFKPFGVGKVANVTTQADYEALPALDSGFSSGKASSAQINKALRQGTVMSSVLAQFIANLSGKDVLDDGNTQLLLNNLILALNANGANNSLQINNLLSEIKNSGPQAVASAVASLGLNTPRMKAFTTSGSFTVPVGVSTIYISGCAGGGGGGGGGGGDTNYFGGGGGGGGAGQSVIKLSFPVTPGLVIPISIGSGGSGATGNSSVGLSGSSGGNTVVVGLITLVGGLGGSGGSNSTGITTAGGIGGVGFPTGSSGGMAIIHSVLVVVVVVHQPRSAVVEVVVVQQLVPVRPRMVPVHIILVVVEVVVVRSMVYLRLLMVAMAEMVAADIY